MGPSERPVATSERRFIASELHTGHTRVTHADGRAARRRKQPCFCFFFGNNRLDICANTLKAGLLGDIRLQTRHNKDMQPLQRKEVDSQGRRERDTAVNPQLHTELRRRFHW